MWDEHSFLKGTVQLIDQAIASGKLPPVIVAAPDGSISGRPSYSNAGSFYVNSKAGNFEDYIIQDVWTFVVCNYPVRMEREAHVIAGGSMGGFGAFNLGMKYQDHFKIVIGVYPPLNLRWLDCHCRYMSHFDPCCWGWRTSVDRGNEIVGRYGPIFIPLKKIVDPLFGRGPQAVAAISHENPIEMLDRFGIQDGMLDMYIAYAGRDEFNIDAQVESFLYVAHQRGLTIGVGYEPNGRHNQRTAAKLFPALIEWLAPRLEPYAPWPACLWPGWGG
jgi:hypothetical protein